jgi:hypothetical protein
MGIGDDAQFAARLNCVGVLDAGEALRKGLELFKALDVFLQRLAASAGARR